MKTEKPWGEENLLHVGFGYAVKLISLNPGQRTSLHYHNIKHEFIYVQTGILEIDLGADQNSMEKFKLHPGDFLAIEPKFLHRMSSGPTEATYLESQTDHLDDVVRIQDDYERKN